MGLREALTTRLERLERVAKEATAKRENYRRNWRTYHQEQAAAFARSFPPEAEPIPDEMRSQRQLEAQRVAADRELATADHAQRSRDWAAERSRILKERVRALQTELTASLTGRMRSSGRVVRDLERKRFDNRRKQLEREVSKNQLAKLANQGTALPAEVAVVVDQVLAEVRRVRDAVLEVDE